MNTRSKISESSMLGSFTSYADTKHGSNTPVRRSCRRTQVTRNMLNSPVPVSDIFRSWNPVPKQSKPAMSVLQDKENRSIDERNSNSLAIDDLCSMFQTTCKVDNNSLEIKSSKTEIISPIPQKGRFVTVMDASSNVLTPVRRSTRNNN